MVLAERDSRSFRSLGRPDRCAGCGLRGSLVCRACLLATPPAVPVAISRAERATAAWKYEEIARSLILDLKLRGNRGAAGPLVDAMVGILGHRGCAADAVTWVPGRRRDIKRRGFDHAEVLASGVADALGLPCTKALERIREPVDQTELGAGERALNVSGAFAPTGVAGRLLLVDDLITTGATATECVAVLVSVGATVEVVAPAHAS